MEETKETQESLQRKREQALQRLRKERTEEALWDCVTAYQDFEFHTYSGLPYSYHMKYGRSGTYTKELWINRREKSNGALSHRKSFCCHRHAHPCTDRRRSHLEPPHRLFNRCWYDWRRILHSWRYGQACPRPLPLPLCTAVHRSSCSLFWKRSSARIRYILWQMYENRASNFSVMHKF